MLPPFLDSTRSRGAGVRPRRATRRSILISAAAVTATTRSTAGGAGNRKYTAASNTARSCFPPAAKRSNRSAARLPSGPWVIEIIAGLQEPGEPADELVHREAEEEAGCKITDLMPVHHYYSSPGSSNEKIQIYFARTETEGLGGIHGIDEEGEDIRVHVVSSDTAFEWLDNGRIDSALPIIALQWFRLNRDSIRELWL